MKTVILPLVAALLLSGSWAALAQVGPPAAVSADPAADQAAAKAREKQVRAWRTQYGEGPYPDEIDAFLQNKTGPLKPYWRSLYVGGERNSVLNFERLGIAAIDAGDWKVAEKAFDAALLRIETVYGKNAQSEAARSLFRKEANKDYKGEPYERAMAYYYRGLLYLRANDYDNARASFKGGEFQDTVSEAEAFKSDFAALNFLIGWSSRCAGDNGDQDFAAATEAQPGLVAPPTKDNILLIAELGHGPAKAQDGAQKQKVIFVPASGFPESKAMFLLAPEKGERMTVEPVQASSVYFQATTRGGRAMDGILDGKANWKTGTANVGSAAMTTGLALMNNSSGYGNTAGIGAGVAVAGALFSAFSSSMKADADIRYWDTLPDNIVIGTTAMKSRFKAIAAFAGNDGPVDLEKKELTPFQGAKCTLVWTRSRPIVGMEDTPGDDLKVRAALARDKKLGEKNRLFRASLNDFVTIASKD